MQGGASRVISAVAAVLLAVAVTGCAVGTGTLRIDEAQEQIVDVAGEVVRAVGLDVALPVPTAALEQCTLRSGSAGLRTRLDLRAPLPDGPEAMASAFDAAAAVLVARGLVLVESGVPGTLLGQRDGITVTIGSDGRMLELDALTGCRPR
jgi:hypothetical protein